MLCVSVNAQERPRQDKFENYVNECTKFFKPDGEACWKAGIVLDERAGAGVKTENEKETIVTEARRFYKKGCDLNFARACNGFVRYNKISNENKKNNIFKQRYRTGISSMYICFCRVRT